MKRVLIRSDGSRRVRAASTRVGGVCRGAAVQATVRRRRESEARAVGRRRPKTPRGGRACTGDRRVHAASTRMGGVGRAPAKAASDMMRACDAVVRASERTRCEQASERASERTSKRASERGENIPFKREL